MNTIKKFLFILTIFITLPLVACADCQSDFDAIKGEFKISYNYNTDTDDFTVVTTIPNNERYEIVWSSQDSVINAEMQTDGIKTTITIPDFKDTTYYFATSATYNECYGTTFLIEAIELKKYNPYADSPKCEGNENFVLCQKEYDKIIDEETFESRLETYEKTEVKSEEQKKSSAEKKENKSSNKKTTMNTIAEYVKDNIIIISIGTLFTIFLIIAAIIIIKKIKKSRRLE